MPHTSRLTLVASAALAAACAAGRGPASQAPATAAAPGDVVGAPDRTEADRALDAGRRPAELLAFLGVRPGMKVAELGAGGGYTTELLARAVGPTARVWAQNSAALLGFVGDAWAARLARGVNANVVRVDREFDAPLPPEVADLDLVLIHAVYHDTVWMQVDRAAMNAAVFRALSPGGVYVVVDSSARPGSGAADAQALHRIDEALVKDEVLAAGFRLAAEGDFLRNPSDTRDWNTSPRSAAERRGTGDRFVLRFVKP